MLEVKYVRQKANLSEQGSSAAKAKRKVYVQWKQCSWTREDYKDAVSPLWGENLCS